MHLSRVDLPQPLRPRMPNVSPWLMSTLTSRSAQNGVYGILPPVDDPLLQRGVLLVVEPELLGDVLDLDGGGHGSELLGEVALEPAEDDQRQQEEPDAHDQDDAEQPGVGPDAPDWEDVVHRVGPGCVAMYWVLP